MKNRYGLPVIVICTIFAAAGCVTKLPVAGPEVLVTFPVTDFTDNPTGGSQRSYHGADPWPVSLHTRQLVRRFARDHNLVQSDAWAIRILNMYCVAFRAREAVTEQQLIDRLSQDSRVSLVQANHQFHGMISESTHYDDPLFELQYGESRRALENLHAISVGANVRVGVIDSGVDAEHPDLKGQIARQVEIVPARSDSDRLHGTAVVGIIGAAADNGVGLVGLAPESSIHVFAACNKNSNRTLCKSYTLAKALVEAIDGDMDVINMSLAGPNDTLLSLLIGKAVDAGIVFVAAGNPENPAAQFPASLPIVHSPNQQREYWFARFEQLSTQAGGSYQVFFGSSIASAGIAGLAVLLRSKYSAAQTNSLLDWLFESDCKQNAYPVEAVGFELERLCE